eukprot:scaffold94140_cov36-Tisochrysis_lutea.AAC.1
MHAPRPALRGSDGALRGPARQLGRQWRLGGRQSLSATDGRWASSRQELAEPGWGESARRLPIDSYLNKNLLDRPAMWFVHCERTISYGHNRVLESLELQRASLIWLLVA